MTLNLTMPGQEELKPRITVFGVGGAGGNAVNNMIQKQLEGVDFVVANTDAQALSQSEAKSRIQLGVKVTEGLGAGAKATIGAAAAEENIEQIVDHLAGAHMCFITAGMGGGTGTGAAPIIAQAARELGVLTVGVVTKPFQFEGGKRMRQAEDGVDALQAVVDTLIIIPNQNLFRLANEKTTFTEAFSLADDVLYQGVKGVTDLMVRPGLINLDFADVRAVMDEMGKAMMGTGEDSGEDRAIQAAEKAIANPLLDEISLQGAKGVLINITGGHDLTLFELDEAANRIREEVDAEANIIVGSTLDTSMDGVMRVSVVATGIDAVAEHKEVPKPRRSLAEPLVPTREMLVDAQADVPTPVVAPDVAARVEETEQNVAARRMAEPQAEPGLFDARTAAEQDQMEDIFDGDDAPAADDGLPPPAYQPQPEPHPEQQTVASSAEEIEPADMRESFVAPRAPAAGQPSADTLRRLEQAVGRTPSGAQAPRSPVTAPVSIAAPKPAAQEPEKKRFGINSLIDRMTGSSAESTAPAARPVRQQPPVSGATPEQAPREEEDQIEIPAFLRRQAN
ncbi:MAG: cell division protein FtsZ [Pseudomonadota bacterium]